MNKPIIDGIVIVEGKTDTSKLQSLFDVQTIETNGSALSKKTINVIKEVAKHNKIILLLDPDGPGQKIRTQLINEIDQCFNIFLEKKDIKKSKKFGIAEAYDDALINAFNNLIKFDNNQQSLDWNDYLSLNLNTKQKRSIITCYFKLPECNHKKLFKWLNLMQITFIDLKEIIHE